MWREEQLPHGRSTRVTSTLRREQLVVSSNGYKENDFNVSFDATENESSLRVRRQIYSDRLTQPVVVDSIYDRTAEVAAPLERKIFLTQKRKGEKKAF